MNSIHDESAFRLARRAELAAALSMEQNELRALRGRELRVDLHCHDHNSDVPDELWGRILRLRETWITPRQLLDCLKLHGTDLPTITNHNNARSCWELQDAGIDVLSGAEFTCHFREFGLHLHVQAFGFNPTQEVELEKRRQDLKGFLRYAREQLIPTVLPHPLYFYKKGGIPPLDAFEQLLVLFQRFECLNGQRDVWQNLLAWKWVRGADEAHITELARKHHLDPKDTCFHPWRKSFSGGTDDHLGLFAGSCGTLFSVHPEDCRPFSLQVLDALRDGRMAPYGQVADEEKMALAFMDYLCQCAIHFRDPGLMRLLLHRGEPRDKIACLLIGNGLLELQRKPLAIRAARLFHRALRGEAPSFLIRFLAPPSVRPILADLRNLALERRAGRMESYAEQAVHLLPNLFGQVTELLCAQIEKILASLAEGDFSFHQIDALEIPLHLRSLLDQKEGGVPPVAEAIDGLGIAAIAPLMVAFSKLMSSRSLHGGRGFLSGFAEAIGAETPPRRLLWFADNLEDAGAHARLVEDAARISRAENAAIDIVTVSNDLKSEPRLFVLSPVREFKVGGLPVRCLRIPDYFALHDLVKRGGYDRILCSGGPVSLLTGIILKETFLLPLEILVIDNWLESISERHSLDRHQSDRLRRILRSLYRCGSRIYAPTSEQGTHWLAGEAFELGSRLQLFRAGDAVSLVEQILDLRPAQAEIDTELFSYDEEHA